MDEERGARPLKIALLTHSVNPRGGVVHTLELAHALHDAGHDVTVIAPAAAGEDFFRPVRCRKSLVAVGKTPRDMVEMVRTRIEASASHLSEMLRHERFDVLHAHDPIGANALANLQDEGLIERFVRTVHHLERFAAPELMFWQARGFLRASQVLCVSRLWCAVLARDHGVEAAQVSNGVDAARFGTRKSPHDALLAERLGVRARASVVLAVGGVEERKNTVRLLEAFVLHRAQRPDSQLVVAGGASLLDHTCYAGEFNALAQASGLAIGPREPIVLTGPLADADMPGLYRRADVVAMPSLTEGFGLVVLEALASGVPVVVSRIAPFTEYLRDEDCHWADPRSAPDIAKALRQAIDTRNPTRIGCTAARLVARFSWAASAAHHDTQYRRGLAQAMPPLSLAAS